MLALALAACSREPEIAEPGAMSSAKPLALPAGDGARKLFGSALGSSPRAELSEVLASPDKFKDQTVTVEGNVRSACTRKGCWMELTQTADAASPGCRVTFKDYGFFVPTDSAGSRARVEASVETKTIKPSMVAHLEEEGAKFADKAANGAATEVRLVATGVEMWR